MPESEELLFGKLVKGGVVKVSVDKEKDTLVFAFEEATSPRRPAAKDEPDEPGAPKEPVYVE